MKRALLVGLLVAGAAGAAVFFQTAARQRAYRTFIARGDAALRDNQTFAAMEAYSGAIALRPDSMLAYLRRGQTYQRRADRGDLDLAARDFRTAASLDPTSPRPLEQLGDALYQLQQYARAADAFERGGRLDDRSARLALKLALARYRDGDLDGAIAAANQTLRLDDKSADAHYLIGICQRDKGRTGRAVAALERAAAIAPASIAVREELAALYGAANRRADEIDQLQLLAGLDRTHAERQVAVALAHARARRWELAALTLTNALERTPDNPTLYGALGRVWLDSGHARGEPIDLGKARDGLERLASNPGATSETLTVYGRALLADDDVERAERVLQEAGRRFPVDPEALQLFAAAAERLGHLRPARDALIGYDALAPDTSGSIVSRIADLSLRANEPDVAATWYRRAVAENPADLRAITGLADAQLRIGDLAGAEATLARGLERDPGNVALADIAHRLTRARSSGPLRRASRPRGN